MLNDRFYKMSVHEYSDGMPYGELRIQRQIKVPEAEKDKRLPTLEEAMSFLEKEWNKGKGFDVGRYRYESGISYPLTEKGLQAFNSFWFENRLFSHRIKDEVLATRLISGWGCKGRGIFSLSSWNRRRFNAYNAWLSIIRSGK